MSNHEIVVAPELGKPVGFSHAVIPGPGTVVYLGGQTPLDAEGNVVGTTIVEQFDRAAYNLVCAMRAAGCAGEDLVSLQIFCTDIGEYVAALRDLAPLWRRHFGRRYPAMGLFGVTRLFDLEAKIELMGVAVRPTKEPTRA
jgi:enamine deaminase RidA (YjgF/YER057c/UK114 family)